LVAERTAEPTFADSGRPANQQIVVRIDPGTLHELEEEGAIEAARGAVIDVFDASLVAQLGVAQTGGESLVAAMADFALEQQAEPFEMGELGGFAAGLDFVAGLEHGVEAELAELVERGMSEHDGAS
jgi:hypothetical protein